jgi:hypothetical protein
LDSISIIKEDKQANLIKLQASNKAKDSLLRFREDRKLTSRYNQPILQSKNLISENITKLTSKKQNSNDEIRILTAQMYQEENQINLKFDNEI